MLLCNINIDNCVRNIENDEACEIEMRKIYRKKYFYYKKTISILIWKERDISNKIVYCAYLEEKID